MPKKTVKSRKKSVKKRSSSRSSRGQDVAILKESSRFKSLSTLLGRKVIHEPAKQPQKLPSIWKITESTAQELRRYRVIFLGITVIYALLNLVLVRGLNSGLSSTSLKSALDHVLSGSFSDLFSSSGVFTTLINSNNSSIPGAGSYQFMLILTTSLATIWALRQLLAGISIRIRDGFYQGMYPLIPFVLVLLVICIQFLPLVIGAKLYTTVITGGIAVHLAEKVIWFLLFLGLGLWSLYMVSASVFALYIVTLPEMTPIKALRSARKIVSRRRWTVLRKILCLPLVLLLIASVIMFPVILIATTLSPWVFFLLTMAALVVVHTYMYNLYRELLNE